MLLRCHCCEHSAEKILPLITYMSDYLYVLFVQVEQSAASEPVKTASTLIDQLELGRDRYS